MCVGLSGPVKFFVYRFYVCGALRAGKLVCVGWLSSLRRFLALLAVVSTSFPCLVILLLFTRGTSLLLAAFREFAYCCVIVPLRSVLLLLHVSTSRIVLRTLVPRRCFVGWLSSPRCFLALLAVVSASFPCRLYGCERCMLN